MDRAHPGATSSLRHPGLLAVGVPVGRCSSAVQRQGDESHVGKTQGQPWLPRFVLRRDQCRLWQLRQHPSPCRRWASGLESRGKAQSILWGLYSSPNPKSSHRQWCVVTWLADRLIGLSETQPRKVTKGWLLVGEKKILSNLDPRSPWHTQLCLPSFIKPVLSICLMRGVMEKHEKLVGEIIRC